MRVAARELGDAGLEVDAEPFPAEQQEAGARRRIAAPSPGRRPRGAKKMETKPAWSSMPSDWYDEKSCTTAMHDRKSSVATATTSLGQTLRDEQDRAENARGDDHRQRRGRPALPRARLGAYQKRASPGRSAATAAR